MFYSSFRAIISFCSGLFSSFVESNLMGNYVSRGIIEKWAVIGKWSEGKSAEGSPTSFMTFSIGMSSTDMRLQYLLSELYII